MGKSRHKQQPRQSKVGSSKQANQQQQSLSSQDSSNKSNNNESFLNWVLHHKIDLTLCILFAFLLGTGFGTGLFTGDLRNPPKQWQIVLGKRIRSSSFFHAAISAKKIFHTVTHIHETFLGYKAAADSSDKDDDILKAEYNYVEINGRMVRDDPSHPLAFAILREEIIREGNGFVHPDLGLLIPAPSGAARGLGFVRDSYNTCQIRCMPGISDEKKSNQAPDKTDFLSPSWNNSTFGTLGGLKSVLEAQDNSKQMYWQEEVLLRIPLNIQMTRTLALHTLLPLIPGDIAPLQELDDPILLALLLAHERGLRGESIFLSYIATLPLNPSCGYASNLRTEALEAISMMGVEWNMDVNGWPGEINKAEEHAGHIVDALVNDYGPYISIPKGENPFEVLQWALCQVASRAMAGSEKHGGLRMVPMIDMINHYVDAGEFEEFKGSERLENGDLINAHEDDSGTIIVRSIRHGRRKPLKKGQELLANYNVPDYSPLDWFISLGFVPPERGRKWILIEGALPKVRVHSTATRRNL